MTKKGEPSALDSVSGNGGSLVRDARRAGAVPPELVGGRDAATAVKVVVESRGNGPRRRMAVTKSMRVSVGVTCTGVDTTGGTGGKSDGVLCLAAVADHDDDDDDDDDGEDGRTLAETAAGGDTAAPQLARSVAQANIPVSV